MDTNEAMRALIDGAGFSARGASLAMGRSDNWLSATLARPGGSKAATVAELAGVCGYKLALVPSGAALPSGSIVIDPPARD